jgi:hypothetical protein
MASFKGISSSTLRIEVTVLVSLVSGVAAGWGVEFLEWNGIIIGLLYGIAVGECIFRLYKHWLKGKLWIFEISYIFGVIGGRILIAYLTILSNKNLIPPDGLFFVIRQLYDPKILPFFILVIIMISSLFWVNWRIKATTSD